jgi:cytochrome b pre-mRNA-processing protein 3
LTGISAIWRFGAHDRMGVQRLLKAMTAAARQPAFFTPGRVPDTLEGRLELVYLHAALVMYRLKDEEHAKPLAQAFADALFRYLDDGLREAGVGDVSVPRQMRKLAGAFYGRLKSYTSALQAKDRERLTAAMARNFFRSTAADAPFALVLADYAAEAANSIALAPVEALERRDTWRPAPGAAAN